MITKHRVVRGPAGAWFEEATVIHEGKEFTALGAMVSPTHAVSYPYFCKEYRGAIGELRSWHGTQIGTCRIVAMWRLPWNTSIATYMYQIEATIADKIYTGRGCGTGMSWRGKAKSAR